MTPESKRFFDLTKEALIKGLGASTEDIDTLREEAQQALIDGQYEEAEKLTQKLSKLSALREELLSTPNTITPILERYGYQDEDIPFEIDEEQEANAKTEIKGTRKPEKYIDDARPTIAEALIAQTPEGDFLYHSLEQIGKLILQEEVRDDEDALNDASLYVYVTAKEIVEKVPEFAEDAGVDTMHNLVTAAIGRLRNPAWESFYTKASEAYGDLSPQQFVDDVILRIFPEKQDVKKDVEKRRREKKKIEEKLRPKHLKPVDELCLANKFLRPGALSRIKKEVLDGREPEVIARKHGWQNNLNIPQAFERSRLQMAKKRKNTPPTEEEARNSNWVIQKVILRLREDRRGWHMINEDYTAFRFVFYLMGEINDSSSKVDLLVDTLYPQKEYTVDARSSFLLLGIQES